MNIEGVESVARDLGTALVEHLSGGHFGAMLVTTGRGASAVLKVLPSADPAEGLLVICRQPSCTRWSPVPPCLLGGEDA